MRSFLKEIEEKFDEIEEANVTANLDGGEGPIKTPHAFAKSKDADDLDDDHIEVLGYKKSKEKKVNTKKLEALERKLENNINEISKNEGIFDKFKKRSIKGTPDKEPYYFEIADKALAYLQKKDKEWRKYKLASVGPGDKKTYIRIAVAHKTDRKSRDPEFKVYHDKDDNIKKVVELERKLENKINEISYKEFKKDDSRKQHQKINDSIKEINSMMFKLERIVNQNAKLKTEAGEHTGQYWESTQKRFGKISERMLKVARQLKELGA